MQRGKGLDERINIGCPRGVTARDVSGTGPAGSRRVSRTAKNNLSG